MRPNKNCTSRRCFTSSVRAIGSSFQLAITAPQLDLTGYGTATAQSCPLPHHLRPVSVLYLATVLSTTPHHNCHHQHHPTPPHSTITLPSPQNSSFYSHSTPPLPQSSSTTPPQHISSASLRLSISVSTPFPHTPPIFFRNCVV